MRHMKECYEIYERALCEDCGYLRGTCAKCGDCEYWRGTCANREISKSTIAGRIAASEICNKFKPRRGLYL